MDELAISTEELAAIIGPENISPPPQKRPPAAPPKPAPAPIASPVAMPPVMEPPLMAQPSVTARPAPFAP
ncbi:MAG TPA: hypothetical protein PKD98_31880, partial [Anaerolineae bacterium]|nr:hypothetical protein [Anaerolineae bacterium]